MAVGGFMHCAIMTVSLEHIDWYHKIVLSFGLLVCADCVLSQFKTVSSAECLQIMHISHDIGCVSWETAAIHTAVTFHLMQTNPAMPHMCNIKVDKGRPMCQPRVAYLLISFCPIWERCYHLLDGIVLCRCVYIRMWHRWNIPKPSTAYYSVRFIMKG